jgi:hypothetical protein
MTPGQFATMTWNYDTHYLPDDATTRMGFPGPFGAWIVSTTTPILAHMISLEDLVTSMSLHHGIEKSLLAKLKRAIKYMEKDRTRTAANRLKAFINAVEAQRGKKIADEQADILVADAQAIIDLLSG